MREQHQRARRGGDHGRLRATRVLPRRLGHARADGCLPVPRVRRLTTATLAVHEPARGRDLGRRPDL